MTRLLDLPPTDWPGWFEERGLAAFQGRIASRQVFQNGAASWEDMTDLPSAVRASLTKDEPLVGATLEQVRKAPDGAVKVLLAFPDGARVEAVGMPGTRGRTLCVSSQVGCPVRCQFCASGLDGLERNLTPSEILEQVFFLRREQGDFGRLVVMGMGEPGHNLDAVLIALDALIDPAGMGMSARRITLSTVAPKGTLPRLAQWGRPIKLALSLHAPEDALRHELIPGVRLRGVRDTLDEADDLFGKTGREYTVEYVLLHEVNDSKEQAGALAALLSGRRLHVNLIPYNSVAGLEFKRPPIERQKAFADLLRESGLPVTLRRSLGGAEDAACGQLRRRPAPTTPGASTASTRP